MLLPNDPALPNELAVVGENKENPEELLVVGSDGTYYAYPLTEGQPRPVEPDDAWKVEIDSPNELFA